MFYHWLADSSVAPKGRPKSTDWQKITWPSRRANPWDFCDVKERCGQTTLTGQKIHSVFILFASGSANLSRSTEGLSAHSLQQRSSWRKQRIEELSPHSALSIDSDTLMRWVQSITGDEASGLSRSSKPTVRKNWGLNWAATQFAYLC